MGLAAHFFFEKERVTSGMATTHEKERELEREIGPQVAHDLPGVEVLAVELTSPDRFVVYVDHPDGVDHALCVRVTDVLREYLRQYAIDVSSPGTERPLRTPSHFAGVIGRHVKLRTTEAKKLKGEVVAADATHVTIDENEIPYESIVRANLIDER
jgi:ribosome maturation factor RimP